MANCVTQGLQGLQSPVSRKVMAFQGGQSMIYLLSGDPRLRRAFAEEAHRSAHVALPSQVSFSCTRSCKPLEDTFPVNLKKEPQLLALPTGLYGGPKSIRKRDC